MQTQSNSAIQSFEKRVKSTFEKGLNTGKLQTVRGNFGVVVHNTAVWVVVTDGAQRGIYREMTEDKMDFMMVTTPEVFEAMNQPQIDRTAAIDHEAIIEDGNLAMHGDFEVYLRFLKIGEADSLLSIRGGSSKKPASSRRRNRRSFA